MPRGDNRDQPIPWYNGEAPAAGGITGEDGGEGEGVTAEAIGEANGTVAVTQAVAIWSI